MKNKYWSINGNFRNIIIFILKICFCAEASDIIQSYPVMSHSSTDFQIAVMYSKLLVNNS